MATVGLGQALRMALELLDAGRAGEAEALCRRLCRRGLRFGG